MGTWVRLSLNPKTLYCLLLSTLQSIDLNRGTEKVSESGERSLRRPKGPVEVTDNSSWHILRRRKDLSPQSLGGSMEDRQGLMAPHSLAISICRTMFEVLKGRASLWLEQEVASADGVQSTPSICRAVCGRRLKNNHHFWPSNVTSRNLSQIQEVPEIFNYKDVYHSIIYNCGKAEITNMFYNGDDLRKW